MRLAVPLTSVGEAGILAQAGATEFYCGVQTREWMDSFGDHDSISRRQGAANLSSIDELKQVLSECKALDAPLFLTLNGNYSQEQLPYVIELAETFELCGGAGIMTMDISLLAYLQRQNSKLLRGLTILAAVSSIAALRFYCDLGIHRVVLPRFLSISQMGTLLSAFPNIQGEALVWLDKCRFIDGYCRFLHSTGYADAPYQDCTDCSTIHSYDTTYMLPACFELFGFPPPQPACAACSLDALAKTGISIFKMGGRGRSLQTRLDGASFLKKASELADDAQCRRLYQASFGAPCDQQICYYAGTAQGSSR